MPADCSPEGCASSDRALVARLRAGDDAAYATLVRDFGPRMLVVARGYLPSMHDAEDVLQSAFLLVFRFIHRFEGSSKFSTWLHRIVVNCALMRLRSRRRHPTEHLNVTTFEDRSAAGSERTATITVDDDVDRRETYARLLRGLEFLPPTLRAAVRLHDVQGLTVARISVLLGRSLTAVKMSLHRGRNALRAIVAPAGPFVARGVRQGETRPAASRARVRAGHGDPRLDLLPRRSSGVFTPGAPPLGDTALA